MLEKKCPFFVFALWISFKGMSCAGCHGAAQVSGIILSFCQGFQIASSSFKNILDNKRSSNTVSATVIQVQLLYYRHKEKIFDHCKLNLWGGGRKTKPLAAVFSLMMIGGRVDQSYSVIESSLIMLLAFMTF